MKGETIKCPDLSDQFEIHRPLFLFQIKWRDAWNRQSEDRNSANAKRVEVSDEHDVKLLTIPFLGFEHPRW